MSPQKARNLLCAAPGEGSGYGRERPKFGLRSNFILLEDSEQMKARWADTERFVVEAAEAVIRQVGRKTAQQLFRIALREPKKGSVLMRKRTRCSLRRLIER